MAPSRTSQAVALVRAELERPATPEGDRDAQRRLCAGMTPTRAPTLRPHIATRTEFFDDHVLRALGAGIRQIVVCGAGYDDRALRFRADGVRFFELDHPGTQADKAHRLSHMKADSRGLTMVPVDFRSDDVAAALARSGHDGGELSLFICEGLLAYLEGGVIARLLESLAAQAALGSVLAVSLAVHPNGLDSKRVTAAANARRRSGRSEPWVTILPVEAHLRLLERAGWLIEDSIETPGVAGSERGSLLVTATPR